MFGPRPIALVSFLVLSTKVFAQIPAAFTSGFDPTNIELVVNYGGAIDKIQDGEQLTPADATAVPKFALGDSSAISKSSKYIILMIDPDSPARDDDTSVQVLHYLKSDFAVTDITNLGSSAAAAAMPYAGPDKSVGTGPHRYIFLLYDQPSAFQNVGVPDPSNRTFSVASWKAANNLKPAVAGVHFVATPPSAGVEGDVSTPPCTSTAMWASSASVPAAQLTTDPYPTALYPTATATAISTALPSSPSPPTAATTHKVTVGGPNTLTYQPASVDAAAGDVILFDFLAKNHTVTQSTFDDPCVPNPAAGAARSGFRPNPQNVPGAETFAYTVPADGGAPKWFFCAQQGHCRAGMVFAVNPGTKMAAFVARATGGAVSSSADAVVSSVVATGVATGAPAPTDVVAVPPYASSALPLYPVPTTLVATGTGGLPVPTGNVSAPGATGVPVFTGGASRGVVSSWVLTGIVGLLVALL